MRFVLLAPDPHDELPFAMSDLQNGNGMGICPSARRVAPAPRPLWGPAILYRPPLDPVRGFKPVDHLPQAHDVEVKRGGPLNCRHGAATG